MPGQGRMHMLFIWQFNPNRWWMYIYLLTIHRLLFKNIKKTEVLIPDLSDSLHLIDISREGHLIFEHWFHEICGIIPTIIHHVKIIDGLSQVIDIR